MNYWNDIPVGRENAATYEQLCEKWHLTPRQVRNMLHDLSSEDNGDNYVLIRSSKCKGFYKTDDVTEITAYRKECLNKGRSVFAPVHKINRILAADSRQFSFENNLRVYREAAGLTQGDVCNTMRVLDNFFDEPLLSKMENGRAIPTPYQTCLLARIYGCKPSDIINADLYY